MNVLTLPTTPAVPTWISRWLRDNLANRRSRLLLAALGCTLAAGGLPFAFVRKPGYRGHEPDEPPVRGALMPMPASAVA